MIRFLYILTFLASVNTFAQVEVAYLVDENPLDSIVKESITYHSSVKPQIRIGKPSNYIKLQGIGDLNYLQKVSGQYKLGAGLNFTSQFNNKWYFRLAAISGISNLDSIYYPKAYFTYPMDSVPYGYTDVHARLSYTPNHVFNFQVGLDNNFIGEGSRSLLLSDFGNPYPFAQIRARFWRLEYTVLYQFMRERKNSDWQSKFGASHHISINATKWLNFGIFESVIFQPKDTLLNRGFDVEYLNPVIFYRPQEYALGSSDNVLLGVSMTAKYKKHTFYTQFILDEFYLAEVRAKSGWWANKFGGQFGFKGRFGKDNNWFYRAEYNFVRPYTFAHLSEELNYGNQGTNLAHPYGANFMEGLVELKFQKGKILATTFNSYTLSGNSINGYNYGENTYSPYINRPYEYGHFIGQGGQVNRFKNILSVSYNLNTATNLNAFIENHMHYIAQINKWQNMVVIGVRSQLWNDRRNY